MRNKLMKIDFKKFKIKDRGTVFSFTAACSGVILGAIITSFFNNDLKNEVLSLFISFNTEFVDKTKSEIFSGIALSGVLYFFVMVISGSSFFGKYLSFFATVIKTMGIGALVSFFYDEYGIRGLEYVLLVFAPGKAFLFIGILLITKCCYDTVNAFFNSNAEKNPTLIRKLYIIKCSVAFLLLLISWTIDFICLSVFSDLFSFNI